MSSLRQENILNVDNEITQVQAEIVAGVSVSNNHSIDEKDEYLSTHQFDVPSLVAEGYQKHEARRLKQREYSANYRERQKVRKGTFEEDLKIEEEKNEQLSELNKQYYEVLKAVINEIYRKTSMSDSFDFYCKLKDANLKETADIFAKEYIFKYVFK